MNSLSRILSAVNWKYAFGEVMLIFVGISLALVANSWYEDARDRKEEKEILQQILVSLRTDINAFDANRVAIKEKLRLMGDLQSHLDQGLPYRPELDKAFSAILMVEGIRMNTAPFETLTYRGIDLVSDTDLRGRLVDYYDTQRDRLDRRNEFDFVDAMSAEPFFKKNFRWSKDNLAMTPVDYGSLASNQEFLNILAVRIWAHRTHTLSEYTRISEKASDLASVVETHIKDLD
jgi:hypothetical protein